jgi:hypothetical protein
MLLVGEICRKGSKWLCLARPLSAPSGDVDALRLPTTESDAGENLYANPLAT